ncbi:MAG: D-alanyl-D-alanine carboxypeptidase [Lachnospiraceae bacterium]|nr:D-alanyl-D-alanine carboxypeptidase [Lachnospiraceae bacterium]
MKRHPAFRILSLILCVLFLLQGASARAAERAPETVWPALSSAAELPEAPEIASDFAVLAEAKSGTVLYGKNAFDRAAPASITKVMTALLTAERCDLNETVLFSYRACHELEKGSSTIARTEGETMSVSDCLFALLVASANEVAQALAEHVSGSIEAFVALMNDRARELGCVNTHFANPHGTPDPEHYTCCYDMVLIMKAAMERDIVREAMGTAKYQIAPTNKHNEITYLNSKHPLVTNTYKMKYEGAVAGKTGHTSEALSTLVTYAVRGDMDLICVVMHADSTQTTGEDSTALFNYGFENFFRADMLAQAANDTALDPVFLGSDILGLTSSGSCYVTLPKGADVGELVAAVHYGEGDAASDEVAVREYSLNGVVLARLPLKVGPVQSRLPITPETVRKKTAKERLRTPYLGIPLIYWIIIAGALVLLGLLGVVIFLIIRILQSSRRREVRRRRALSRIEEPNDRFL